MTDQLRHHFSLIPANKIARNLANVPTGPGVYMFFVRGGQRLLEQTSYFDLDGRAPAALDSHIHLYTGAANDLQLRMKQHFHRDRRSSTFRETLLAIEIARQAISKSLTPASMVTCEETLSRWLFENVIIGFRYFQRPFQLESELIEAHVSPFNITLRRTNPYARALMQWRHEAFPRWRHPSRRSAQPSRPNRVRTVRSSQVT